MTDAQLEWSILKTLRPPDIISPVEFAESQIVLPASANSQPGPLELASYQKELVESIAADDCEIVVMMLSSQVGKSLAADAQMAWMIAQSPGPALHISPTGDKAQKFVRNRFDPLVAASPALRALVGTGDGIRTVGGDSYASKSYPGGTIDFGSSFRADDLASKAVKWLWADEIDRFAINVGNGEGDPLTLAMKRTRTFEGAGRKVIIISTPTTRLGSRIAAWFERGDKRRFFVPCPDCGHAAPLDFERLTWTPGQPETAGLSCSECGAIQNEIGKRRMVDAGVWRPTAVGEPGVRSYHLNELASKFSSLASVAQQYEAAQASPEQLQAFNNTTLARVWDSSVEVELNPGDLQQRATTIASPYPKDVRYITAGVDVQGNRLEATILATAAQRSLVINHHVVPGDTSSDAPWLELDRLLGETHLLQDGRRLGVQIIGVDSGFSVDQVIRFVRMQRSKQRRTFAIKGVAGFEKQAVREGGKLKGQMRLLLVGVDGLKLSLQKRLAMQERGAGYIELPDHLDADYFSGLASEQLTAKNVRGFTQYRFERTVRQNEALDALVYATAVATLAKDETAAPRGVPQTPPVPKLTVAEQAARLHALNNPHLKGNSV